MSWRQLAWGTAGMRYRRVPYKTKIGLLRLSHGHRPVNSAAVVRKSVEREVMQFRGDRCLVPAGSRSLRLSHGLSGVIHPTDLVYAVTRAIINPVGWVSKAGPMNALCDLPVCVTDHKTHCSWFWNAWRRSFYWARMWAVSKADR